MRISDWSSDVCSSDLVAAVALVGEEIGAEKLVERRGDLRRLLFHHLAGARLEIATEAFEHRLPFLAAARPVAPLFLQPGGEIIDDLAFDEAFDEGGETRDRLLGDDAAVLAAPSSHIH